MEKVSSGYGNSGTLAAARQKAWGEKPFRYLIITTSGGTPGLGGDFNYEIRGTDRIKEILEPSIIREQSEIIDTKTGKVVGKNQLAQQFLRSLTKKQRESLIDQTLLDYLAGK